MLLRGFVEKRWSNALTSCWPVGRVITLVSEQPSGETTPPSLNGQTVVRTHSGAIDNCRSSVLYCTNTTISIASARRPWSSRSSRESRSRVKWKWDEYAWDEYAWDEYACPNAYKQQQ
jgi:hypothetical protein